MVTGNEITKILYMADDFSKIYDKFIKINCLKTDISEMVASEMAMQFLPNCISRPTYDENRYKSILIFTGISPKFVPAIPHRMLVVGKHFLSLRCRAIGITYR